jgi:hypothetical protein
MSLKIQKGDHFIILSLFIFLILICSCEESHKNNISIKEDSSYFKCQIKDNLYQFDEDTSMGRWQNTNRQGIESNGSDEMRSTFGLYYYDQENKIITRAEIYFAYNHSDELITGDYIFYGRKYFIADSNFHNMFYLGEHEFLYKVPTKTEDILFKQDEGVYIQLNISDSIMYPSLEYAENYSFSPWRSYKIINDIYISNPNNFFEVLESETLNLTYNLNKYGESRSRRIKGLFNCMLFKMNNETRLYDSIWIENAEWEGIIEE